MPSASVILVAAPVAMVASRAMGWTVSWELTRSSGLTADDLTAAQALPGTVVDGATLELPSRVTELERETAHARGIEPHTGGADED